jgi:hypothetical protein
MVPDILDLRLRAFAGTGDAAGCRKTAEMIEALEPKHAQLLVDAASFRAVTAGLEPQPGQTPDAEKAMAWLAKAVATGFNEPESISYIVYDSDFNALRDRADFRRLLIELLDRGFPANPFTP